MVMAPDGRTVFITGQSEHAGSSQLFVPREYATVAYDTATGGQRWVARYRGGEDGVTTPKGVAIDPEGTRVFVTGQSVGDTEATWDYGTVAYDASTGARLWAHSYPDLPAQGRGFDVAVGHDGRRVYVTGETNNDAATLAYDAANGSVMWTARFNPTVAGYDAAGARRIVLSPNGGRLFVIGSATNRIDSIRWQQGLYDGDLDRGYVWAYDL